MSIFAFIGAASPGPVNIIATTSSVSYGFKRTLPHVLGASVSYAGIVYLVGAGLGELLEKYPQITLLLKYMAAAFLLYMAVKIATAHVDGDSSNLQVMQAPSVIQGALAQGLNPKAWLVSMSGVSVFVTPNSPSDMYLLYFTSLSFVICLLGVGMWALFGRVLSSLLDKPSHQSLFNRLMGVVLAISVISMFV
jgi:threonine/homoserine/homoserine lactone efflux protein